MTVTTENTDQNFLSGNIVGLVPQPECSIDKCLNTELTSEDSGNCK